GGRRDRLRVRDDAVEPFRLRQPGGAARAAGQMRLQPRRGHPRLLAVQPCGQCLAYLLAAHAGLSPPGSLLVPTRGSRRRFSRTRRRRRPVGCEGVSGDEATGWALSDRTGDPGAADAFVWAIQVEVCPLLSLLLEP